MAWQPMHIEFLPLPAAASPAAAARDGSAAAARLQAAAASISLESVMASFSFDERAARDYTEIARGTAPRRSMRAQHAGCGQHQHADQGERDAEIGPVFSRRVGRDQDGQAG